MDTPRTISVREAAKLIGIGRDSAYAAAKCGEIPSVRIGNRFRVLLGPLEEKLGKKAPATAAAA